MIVEVIAVGTELLIGQIVNASQFDGTMVPGDPAWKFGLWEPGN